MKFFDLFESLFKLIMSFFNSHNLSFILLTISFFLFKFKHILTERISKFFKFLRCVKFFLMIEIKFSLNVFFLKNSNIEISFEFLDFVLKLLNFFLSFNEEIFILIPFELGGSEHTFNGKFFIQRSMS